MKFPARIAAKTTDVRERLPEISTPLPVHLGTDGIKALSADHGTTSPVSPPVDEEGNFLPYEADNPAVLLKLFHVEVD